MNSDNKKLYKKYEDQYNIARPLNNDLISYNFHNSQNAYSPHALYDTTGKLIYLFDKTVSIIDAKTSRITEDNRNIKFVTNKSKTADKIQDINRKLVENLNEIYQTSVSSVRPYLDKFERKNFLRNKNILKKLYNDTILYKDIFWSVWERNTLVMTEQWRQYFSSILSEFYSYNDSNNFLSKNWKENLFPNNTYLAIREKLQKNQLLTDNEICDFVDYLLHKWLKKDIETWEETIKRHHSDTAKSHLINILYGMMYSEQEYNYKKITQLNIGLFNTSYIDQTLSKELDISKDSIYTEMRQKWLPSIAFKELRWESVTDLIWGRTWLDDELLQTSNKHVIIEKIFTKVIENLVNFYERKWYIFVMESFDLANKFKKWKIIFDSDVLSDIEKNIQQNYIMWDTVDQSKKNTHLRDIYNYDILNIKNVIATVEEKEIIHNALENDNSKTWGNGAYADIKFRMWFHLINKNNAKDVINNQSYEHMIVNMDSSNEWWLSEHNIFLDPIKNIPLKLRISTALDTDIFMDSVCGWIDKTIKELSKLKTYMDNIETKPDGISMKYIEKQFQQRNIIPSEILDMAWLTSPYTYLDLDKNYIDKQKVENTVAEYLLVDQFNKWRLHWFVYDNDNIDWLTENLQTQLLTQKNISYQYFWHSEFLKKALYEKNTWKYCICGWWSNNLAKWCNSKLFSDKGYIWIVDSVKDIINFFTIPVFTWLVAEWTHIKNNDVILWDIKSIYKDQLKKLPKES